MSRRRVKIVIEIIVNDLRLPETGNTGSDETVSLMESAGWDMIARLKETGFDPYRSTVTATDEGEI